MCINSIPEYQVGGASGSASHVQTADFWLKNKRFVVQTFDEDGTLVEEPTMRVLEVFCSCWFTFEVRQVEPKVLVS